MRDIAILAIVACCALAALRRPYIGFMSWVWLSLMTPHRLAWGFMADAPVAMITMLGTLIGTLLYKDKGRLFQHGIVAVQVLFLIWTAITYIFSLFPESSWPGLNKFSKIMLGIFLSYLLVNSREKLNGLLWLMFLSVGFYGIKGGVFTLLHGGESRVWGPPESFIGDNNALACALLMILPIGAYLMTITDNQNIKKGLIVAMALIGVSVLGSTSRGAFLGLLAVFLFWIRKAPGKQKIMVFIIACFIGLIAVGMMPESYWERMHTVKTYEKDASAMGRINAWWCAYNLAIDRFTGAGFDYASKYTFSLYAPNPLDVHTAHSIYFQVLGDHGFVGLALYLWTICWTWMLLGKILRKTQHNESLQWANQLARMVQLSLIAYFSAGAFLSLTYYDLFWQLVAVSVILHTLVSEVSVMDISHIPREAGQKTSNLKYQPFVRPCR